jgi:hypothetical protein
MRYENREKMIELFLNEVSSQNTNFVKAKNCYLLGIKMILEELEHHYKGNSAIDGEKYWKNQLKKYENDKIG